VNQPPGGHGAFGCHGTGPRHRRKLLGSGHRPRQAVQRSQNLRRAVRIRGSPAVRGIQHGFDLVARSQSQVDEVFGGRQFSLAQLVEDRFQIVSEGGDVIETEHRAGSLDGVQRTERPPYHLGIVALLVQFQQGRFQFAEQFAGFFLEALLKPVDHPTILFTTARICCMVNGFTIQPVAPAALPSSLRAS